MFYLDDLEKEIEVRYLLKNTVLKIFIKSVEKAETKTSFKQNRTYLLFSLSEFNLLNASVDFLETEDSYQKSNELSVLDLTFNTRLLSIMILCFSKNENKINYKIAKSFAKKLKQIKEEMGE